MAQSHVALWTVLRRRVQSGGGQACGFPLTPALSPRRGRALAWRWKHRMLQLQSPHLCLSFRRHMTIKIGRITRARANVSPSPRGEGWGEGERSEHRPQAHDESPGKARGFPIDY